LDWDLTSGEITAWTDIKPEEWKLEIENQAKEEKVRLKVELITARTNFDPYRFVVNPYGGVYPEHDVKKFVTLNKIFDYVNEGGMFVNVADIPGYWAYNPLLRRRLEITPTIYGINQRPDGGMAIIPVKPFELTPFMERLGLRVLNTERVPIFNWNTEWVSRPDKTSESMKETRVHRAVVVEKNVEPIIKPKGEKGLGSLTPFFFVNYGEGKFLISLLFIDKSFPENTGMKKVLIEMILKLIRE
jgi:hypothetical protein